MDSMGRKNLMKDSKKRKWGSQPRLTRLARLADPAFHRYPLAEVSVTEKLALLPTVTLGGTYCRILAKSYG